MVFWYENLRSLKSHGPSYVHELVFIAFGVCWLILKWNTFSDLASCIDPTSVRPGVFPCCSLAVRSRTSSPTLAWNHRIYRIRICSDGILLTNPMWQVCEYKVTSDIYLRNPGNPCNATFPLSATRHFFVTGLLQRITMVLARVPITNSPNSCFITST